MERLYWDGEGELYDWLAKNDLHPKRTSKGYSVRCLNSYHHDRSNSAQIFTNDLWWTCYACGERHPLVKKGFKVDDFQRVSAPPLTTDYADHYSYWLNLYPPEEDIKGLPAHFLAMLGWRQLPKDNGYHLPDGIFIPAWNVSKTQIPFFQVRHNTPERRFSFPPKQQPLAFGMESLGRCGEYVAFTEGNTDRATLELAGIPAIAIPSASSGNILIRLAQWCRRNGKVLVACSDNDEAGSKLLRTIPTVYIDLRPPKPYKDYNEMYQDGGIDSIKDRLSLLRKDNHEIIE